MRKIFFAIIALAALVGCNTDMMEEVISTPQYLTTSLEVALDDQTRAYDENLKWSWESTDKIAAYQVAGDQIVNTLSLKENGKFGTEEFNYSTNESAEFKFVYPAAALNADKTLGYVQTGKWTPTLVGAVEATTVDNIGSESIAMQHHSAAFEIRVWDENKTDRKTIKSATITSESDFCNGTTATVDNLSTDTVVFNIAAGDFAFNLTLTATDGTTYTVAVPAKNFVLGKRTILNVQWKYQKATLLAYSSYNQTDGTVIKNDGLSGNAIYVKDVVTDDIKSSDIAAIKLLLNNSESVDITNGSGTANGLAYGQYSVGAKLTTKNGATYTYSFGTVYVTGIPYHADWRNSNPNCSMIKITDKGNYLRVDNAGWFSSVLGCVITPSFHIPGGKMSVYSAIAATTGASSIGNYDRSYYYAGNNSSTPKESGSYVIIPFTAADANNPDTPLIAGADAIELTTAYPCVVHTAKDFSPATSTNIYQLKVTYNKQ